MVNATIAPEEPNVGRKSRSSKVPMVEKAEFFYSAMVRDYDQEGKWKRRASSFASTVLGSKSHDYYATTETTVHILLIVMAMVFNGFVSGAVLVYDFTKQYTPIAVEKAREAWNNFDTNSYAKYVGAAQQKSKKKRNSVKNAH